MIPAIANRISTEGPLPLAPAMAMAADHYYATHQPFGPSGDFVTAPEISQMFGELVGLWLADLWQRARSPAAFVLAELGPGRGTLMDDALRAAGKALPGFVTAARLHLVERSPRLRLLQKTRLPQATHHDDLSTLPDDLPLFLVGNEFLDALPLTQFERTADGWALRRVSLTGFDTTLSANPVLIPPSLATAAVGAIYERNFATETLVAQVVKRLAATGGAALFIDYGYVGPALGDTLQALQGGAYADPLATLGEADISAHVDFGRVAAVAKASVRVSGPVSQAAFLETLGIGQRAAALKRLASVERAAEIEAARTRLTSAGAMGRLFQAIGLSAHSWPEPAGFPAPAA